jgi:pilus assembly protein Flp/PilA
MLERIKDLFYRMFAFTKTEKGQTLVEYALILVLIALVVILMLTGMGKSVNNVYSKINSGLQ